MTSPPRTLSRLPLISALLLAAALPASAQIRYYHTDAIGSVRMVTDEAGAVVARYDFTPFGQDVTSNPPEKDPRGFAGKERDKQTGFDYFGGRYYQSPTGRFTTVDPVMDVEAALGEPQRWNRYAYGLNNPIRFADPDGRSPTLVTGLIGAAIGGAAGLVGSIGAQLVRGDYSPSGIDLREAAAAAAGGAVSGGLAGATLGTSLVASTGVLGIVGVSAVSNAVGGAVTRAVDGRKTTRASDAQEIAVDLVSGAAGGVVGVGVKGAATRRIDQINLQAEAMQRSARGGGPGSFGASHGAAGLRTKAGRILTRAEIAATVAGAKTTNVVVPISREQDQKQR